MTVATTGANAIWKGYVQDFVWARNIVAAQYHPEANADFSCGADLSPRPIFRPLFERLRTILLQEFHSVRNELSFVIIGKLNYFEILVGLVDESNSAFP